MVIVPVLSPHWLSTMNAVMPLWKCVPLPFTETLLEFTVETMLSELKGRFGVSRWKYTLFRVLPEAPRSAVEVMDTTYLPLARGRKASVVPNSWCVVRSKQEFLGSTDNVADLASRLPAEAMQQETATNAISLRISHSLREVVFSGTEPFRLVCH